MTALLSRRARAAVGAVVDLARLARGTPLPAKALVPPGGLAPRQLETVLQDLVRAGLLRSIRGPRGGYELARERRRISIGDIVRAIDVTQPASAATPDPAIDAVLQDAAAVFLGQLDKVSVEDLCKHKAISTADSPGDFHI